MNTRIAKKILSSIEEHRHRKDQYSAAINRTGNYDDKIKNKLYSVFGYRMGTHILWMSPRKLVNGKPVAKSLKTKRMRGRK